MTTGKHMIARSTEHPTLVAALERRVRLARRYILSLYRSRQQVAAFREIHTYCLFIGHARSGHSTVGALLDAHPEIVLADEFDVLQHVADGFRREQIYHLLLYRSRKQADKGRTKAGRGGAVYSYHVPGQWQGRFTTLRVVGSSKAGTSTQHLAHHPELLERLRATLKDVDLKLIYVVRNPYDNISTLILRGNRTFDDAIARYFANCATIAAIMRRFDSKELMIIRHEDLICYPETRLAELCGFLGVVAGVDYLHACRDMLYVSPSKSRYALSWSSEYIDQVRRGIDRFDFLHGYSYIEVNDAETFRNAEDQHRLTADTEE